MLNNSLTNYANTPQKIIKMKTILLQSILFISLFLIGITIVFGQADPQISMIGFDRSIYNPAAINKSNGTIASIIARQQWTGFEGAPSTQVINVSKNFTSKRFALGLTVINDYIGIENSQNIKLKYSYMVNLTEKSTITFGLGAGIINRNINTSKLIFDNDTDPSTIISDQELKPDFDLGIEYNHQNFTAGISCLHFINSYKSSTNYVTPRHYYLYLTYNFNINNQISIKPAMSVNNIHNIFLMELNTIVNYNNSIELGISYRINDAVAAMLRIAITHQIQLGYSYDFSASALRNYSSGTHEIMLIAKFGGNNTNLLKSPRFFD